MAHCLYYQAHIERSRVWMVTAILRSFEHLVFERALNKEESIFEFFVPIQNEKYFLEIIEFFENNKIVGNVRKLPNRLMLPL